MHEAYPGKCSEIMSAWLLGDPEQEGAGPSNQISNQSKPLEELVPSVLTNQKHAGVERSWQPTLTGQC